MPQCRWLRAGQRMSRRLGRAMQAQVCSIASASRVPSVRSEVITSCCGQVDQLPLDIGGWKKVAISLPVRWRCCHSAAQLTCMRC